MRMDDKFPLRHDLEPPGPPPGLRRIIMDSARQALAQPPARDFWTALWEDRILRLAWAGCVVALLAGHLVLSIQSRRHSTVAKAPADDNGGVSAIAAGPPLRLDSRPFVGSAEIHGDDLYSAIY